jgi:hypothetical protein
MNKHSRPVRTEADIAAIDLIVFDPPFATAQVPERNEVPDGRYRVRVDEVRLERGHNGCPLMKWDLSITTGQFTKWHLFKTIAITAASVPIIKADLIVVGLHLEKLSELPLHLKSLQGKTLEVTKRTKGTFVNVYFLKKSRKASQAEPADGSAPTKLP